MPYGYVAMQESYGFERYIEEVGCYVPTIRELFFGVDSLIEYGKTFGYLERVAHITDFLPTLEDCAGRESIREVNFQDSPCSAYSRRWRLLSSPFIPLSHVSYLTTCDDYGWKTSSSRPDSSLMDLRKKFPKNEINAYCNLDSTFLPDGGELCGGLIGCKDTFNFYRVDLDGLFGVDGLNETVSRGVEDK